MKYLIVGLSDLHFSIEKDNANDILQKSDKIFSAISTKIKEVDELIFIISGDVTNEGLKEEFDIAYNFLDYISDYIMENFAIGNISFIISPGNHDCDLTAFTKVQKSQRDNILNNKVKYSLDSRDKKNPLFNDIHLKNYKEFIEKINNFRINGSHFYFNKYVYNQGGHNLVFVTYNSSVFFDLKSKQGDIFVDGDEINRFLDLNDDDIVISISHHPIEWYCRDNLKYYDVLKTDILITGHEHLGDIREVIETRKKYIELKIPALYDHSEPNKSGIMIGILDVESTEFEIQLLKYDGMIYKPMNSSKSFIVKNTTRLHNAYISINTDFYNNLLKAPTYIYKNRKEVSLEDVYVEHRLEELIKKDDDKQFIERKIIKFDEIDYNGADNYVLFNGNQHSGKTSILKVLYKRTYESGFIPLYVGLNEKTSSKQDVLKEIDNQIKKQYKNIDYVYQNLNKVILLIDDSQHYHNKDKIINLLLELKVNYKKMYITYKGRLDLIIPEELNDSEFKIRIFNIKDFGHEQRYKLISNWVSKDEFSCATEENHEITQIKKTLDPLCNKKLITVTPYSLLVFLQAYDENNVNGLINGAKGVYYDYIINRLVIKISEDSKVENNFVSLYLSEVAYYILTNNTFDNEKINEKFLNTYPYTKEDYYNYLYRIKELLIKLNVLEGNLIDTGNFIYPYVFYYFCAFYYNYNLTEKAEDIFARINKLYEEENANIMLYLVHFTKNEAIINKIIETSYTLFSDFPILQCNDDIEIINLFIAGIKNVETYGQLRKNNDDLNKKLDEEQEKDSQKDERQKEILKSEHGQEVVNSFKMMDIISDLLNQRQKTEITEKLINANYDLGLRIASDFIRTFYSKLYNLSMDKDKKIDHDTIQNSIFTLFLILANIGLKLGGYQVRGVVLPKLDMKKTNSDLLIKLFYTVNNFRDENSRLNSTLIKNLKDNFVSQRNRFCEGFLHTVVDHELNYVGASSRKTKEILDKLNSNITYSDNPLIAMQQKREEKRARIARIRKYFLKSNEKDKEEVEIIKK